MKRLIQWVKQHANIWWLVLPLAGIGLYLHFLVALLHYRLHRDPWYLVFFFAIITLGGVAIWRVIRAFRR